MDILHHLKAMFWRVSFLWYRYWYSSVGIEYIWIFRPGSGNRTWTFWNVDIVLWIRIRIAPDPKWIWSKKYSEKLIKFLQFHNKNSQLKNVNSFYKKNSVKGLYLVIICNLTYWQDGNTKVNFMLRIIDKFHEGSETNWKEGYASKTIIPDPQQCLDITNS